METKKKYVALFGDTTTGIVVAETNTNYPTELAEWIWLMLKNHERGDFRLWLKGKRVKASYDEMRASSLDEQGLPAPCVLLQAILKNEK
jgi:hypothetical protein